MIEGPNERYQIATSAFLVEIETKLPTKRKLQAWWRLGLQTPLVAGRLVDQFFFSSHSILPFIFQTTTGRFEKWGGRQFYTKYDLLAEGFFRLACVSIETHNLQPIFRHRGGGGGGSPLYGYVRRQRVWFSAVLVWNRVSVSTILVWNRVWFVHSSLELGMFFRRISYFFIIWR